MSEHDWRSSKANYEPDVCNRCDMRRHKHSSPGWPITFTYYMDGKEIDCGLYRPPCISNEEYEKKLINKKEDPDTIVRGED